MNPTITLPLTELYQLVYEAAGAATAPLLRDNPGYTFPGTEVANAVRASIHDSLTPVGYDPREEESFGEFKIRLGSEWAEDRA